jgi:L-aspartate oxidase
VDLRGDFLIIGSGVAGLRAAISLAEVGDVVVLTKADPAESNTGYAQGGIAAAIGPGDSPALHARDTIEAGDGLSNEAAVEILVGDGVRYVEELCDWGVAFDRNPTGQLALAREAAHSVRRVLHARDATGREIGRVLWSRVSANTRVRVIDDAEATEISMRGGVCVGVEFTDGSGTERRVEAPATLLATGGAGQVFRETTNPGVATGDGVAMAFRAGARITDLEFVQFHPTVLSVEGAPRFLLSEALRGEGARLVNVRGEAFVGQYHPAGDLAPRDRVARAMVWEAQRTGAPVYLSVQHLAPEFVHGRFPTIARVCRVAGLDLATDRVPVSPAAHYVMGGVETDLYGRTSLPGLFAAGEVACTGAHGANRLASNSLLEGLVFGARAAQTMASGGATTPSAVDFPLDVSARAPAGTVPTAFEVRDLMWKQAGLSRDRAGLEGAVRTLDGWLRGCDPRSTDRAHRRTVNLLTVGLLVATAALRREESRGAHFRTDFPERDDVHWKTHAAETRRVT